MQRNIIRYVAQLDADGFNERSCA
eukprot:COSAG02_NODE_63311_length_263_cov_0.951220_1_plen_23_part_01